MKDNYLVLIPARMGSSRFPGKPLVRIGKMTMIERIAKICLKNRFTKNVYVATCDKEIAHEMKKKKINYVMTSKKHERATDRCSEALRKLEFKNKNYYKIITMVQGDEPLIKPFMVDSSIESLKFDKKYHCSNLVSAINSRNDFLNKNIIKIISNKSNEAKYFSREPIPYMKNFIRGIALRQVCIISFTNFGLRYFSKLKETQNEKLESVDMLRFSDNNLKIKLKKINGQKIIPVDTPLDLKKVKKILNLK